MGTSFVCAYYAGIPLIKDGNGDKGQKAGIKLPMKLSAGSRMSSHDFPFLLPHILFPPTHPITGQDLVCVPPIGATTGTLQARAQRSIFLALPAMLTAGADFGAN